MSWEKIKAVAAEVAKGAYEAEQDARGENALPFGWESMPNGLKDHFICAVLNVCAGKELPEYSGEYMQRKGIPEDSELGRMLIRTSKWNKAFNDFALNEKHKIDMVIK